MGCKNSGMQQKDRENGILMYHKSEHMFTGIQADFCIRMTQYAVCNPPQGVTHCVICNFILNL